MNKILKGCTIHKFLWFCKKFTMRTITVEIEKNNALNTAKIDD